MPNQATGIDCPICQQPIYRQVSIGDAWGADYEHAGLLMCQQGCFDGIDPSDLLAP